MATNFQTAPRLTVEQEAISFSRKELAAVYELVQALNGTGNRVELLSVFAEKLSGMVSFDTCALTMIAADTGQMFMEHATGQNGELIKGHQVTLGEGVTGWVIANREAFASTDPRLDFPVRMADSFKSYKSLAAFPLMKEGELHGALTVYSTSLVEYDKDQQKLLREAATLLAAALTSIDSQSKPADAGASFTSKPLPEADVSTVENSFTN